VSNPAAERMARRTKIICTLGPASDTEERIEALLGAGMNVARLNFSHGSHEEHASVIARLRAVAARLDLPVAILQDLQGPKIRTGPLAGGAPVILQAGREFRITTQPAAGDAREVSTTYSALPQDVRPGDRILLTDGAIELQVRAVADEMVITEVVHSGTLGEHQGINLPGVRVSAPALTEKDRADLAFGVAHSVEYIALSFVRDPADMEEAKRLVREQEPGAPPIPIIAKLEKPEAIERLEEILRVADGVMVARGDLGVEMPLERVPRPTRAEASDVANAILDGTDALMLSGETAMGAYPVEAVEVMNRIALATEGACQPGPHGEAERETLPAAVASAAHTLAQQAHARLIVIFTRSGLSAHLISKERPGVPIIAFTPHEAVYRRLALWWGVTPRRSELHGATEELIVWVDERLRADRLAKPGDRIVIMGGMPVAGTAQTNFVKLHVVGE
jgi:pyruvate kinase